MHVLHALLDEEGHNLTDRGTDGGLPCPRLKKSYWAKMQEKWTIPEIAGLRKNGDKNAKQWKKRWEGRFIIDKAKEYKGIQRRRSHGTVSD